LAQLGQGSQQFAAAMEQYKRQADATAVIAAKDEFDRHQLIPTLDGDGGIMSQTGVAAAKLAYGDTQDNHWLYRLTRAREDMAHKLANDAQRALFKEETDRLLLNAERRVEAHVAQQNRVALEQARKMSVEQAVRLASSAVTADPYDWHSVGVAMQGTKGDIGALTANNPELRESAQREAYQAVAAAVVEQLILSSPEAAEQFLSVPMEGGGTVRDLFGANQAAVAKKIEVASEPVQINRELTRILDESRNELTKRVDSQVAMSLARAIPDDRKWKKELLQAVQAATLEDNRLGREEALRQYNIALSILDTRPTSLTGPDISRVRAWLNDPSNADVGGPQLWSQIRTQWLADKRADLTLDVQTKTAMKETQKQRDDEAWDAYMSLRQDERAAQDLGAFFAENPGLSPGARTKIRTRHEADVKQVQKGDYTYADFEKTLNTRADTIESWRENKNNKTSDAYTQRNAFLAHMKDWWESIAERDKKPPTREQVNKEIQARLIDMTLPRPIIRDKHKFDYELTDEERGQYKPSPPEEQPYPPNKLQPPPKSLDDEEAAAPLDIPAQHRRDIIEKLHQNKKPITTKAITDEYNAMRRRLIEAIEARGEAVTEEAINKEYDAWTKKKDDGG
jgi:hypothetical protein